jgi:glycosyltransferase involved in cell wall biosynthesis
MKWGAMAAASVFALPSYQENFALTVVEAMQAGLPVVLSERVNIWRDVTGAGAGVACALDPDAVAAALGPFLQDEARREAFGQRGRVLAGERYTWDRTADATEEVYRKVLGGGPDGGPRP